MFILEAGLSLIALLVALFWPRLGSAWFVRAESLFLRLARRRGLSVLTVGCSALLIRMAILPVVPIPQPYIHDEFSYLLAADTFASGRLTNPTHPMWRYFESFHISHTPTYMSMYFPAQGLVLAAAQVLAGHPWYGVWFSAGLMCATICWMLQGWLPPGWALFGGALAVLRLGVFSYWANSYWGGAVAAVGGALVLGALPRIMRGHRVRNGLLMAAGIVILANSRPVEGLLVCAPAVIVALRAVIAGGAVRRTLIAPTALLVVAAGSMGYYNYRVFGDPFTLAYRLNRAEYASAPVFIWQAASPEPHYRYTIMREFYSGSELGDYREAHTLTGFFDGTLRKAATGILFVCGFVFLPALIMLPVVVFDGRMRYLIASGAVFALGLAINVWMFPHYLAPFMAGFCAILLHCLRRLRAWHPRGRALVRLIPLVCVSLAVLRLTAGPLDIGITRWPTMWYGTEPFGMSRAEVLATLERYPGRQLALVRYAPGHKPFDEWVYNAADIDKSKVVWAREPDSRISPSDLLGYFADRRVWLIEPDSVPPGITPYLAGQASSTK